MKIFDADVLVIGGGNAGLRAAIEASKFRDLRVIVVSKTRIPGGSSIMAAGHFNAPGFPPEFATVDDIFKDTIRVGCYLNDQRMLRACLEEVYERIMEIERFGGIWPRQNTPDQYHIEPILFDDFSKHYQVYNWYAWEIAKTLYEEAVKCEVEFFPEVMITNLLPSNGTVVGAAGIDIKSGDFLIFKAKSTILATGGATQLFKYASCHKSLTGDGIAMALRIGAELANMEFIQWTPTTNIKPPELAGTRIPLWIGALPTKYIRKIKFLNALGERFMKKYDPIWMEMAEKNVLCRAIFNEVRQGRGTKHGGILIDLSELPEELNIKWKTALPPQTIDYLRDVFDEEEMNWKKPFEVGPAASHTSGGVRRNIKGETSISGLFAVGEVSSGLDGAERLRGNSLAAEALAMGRRVGESAAKRAQKVCTPKIDWDHVKEEYRRVFAPLERREGTQPFEFKKSITNLMWEKAGIIRNEDCLKNALDSINRLKREALDNLYVADKHTRYNCEWVMAMEVLNMLDCAEVIIRAALFRTESRAGHYREDYPKRDENWCCETGIRLMNGEIKVYKIPVEFTYLKPGEVGWPEDWLYWKFPKGI